MAKKKTWVESVDQQLQDELSARHHRPILCHHGEQTEIHGKSLIDLYFNDLIMNQVKSKNPLLNNSVKFGYHLRRIFNFHLDAYQVWAGFEMQNKILAANGFIRNIRNEKKSIAKGLKAFLEKSPSLGWACWSQSQDQDFMWSPKLSAKKIEGELNRYGDIERPTTTLNKDMPGLIHGASFSVERELKSFRNLSETELKKNTDKLTKASLRTFKELEFLYYHLWPRDMRSR